MLYKSKVLATSHIQKMNVAEIRMLRWIQATVGEMTLRRKYIKVGRLASMVHKMWKASWDGSLEIVQIYKEEEHKCPSEEVSNVENDNLKRGKGRLRKNWWEMIRHDIAHLQTWP